MRILVAHAFYRFPGGEDQYVRQEIDLLRSDGHEVHLLETRNIELTPTLATTRLMLGSPRHAAEKIERFGPDLVHVHNHYPSLGQAVHRATQKLGIPLVQTLHNYRLRCPNGYMFTEGQVCRRCIKGNYANGLLHECFPSWKQAAAYTSTLWLHRFVSHLESAVSLFLAPSRFMMDLMVDLGLPSDRVRLLRNFTDISTPAEQAPTSDEGAYVGRLSSEKGLHNLIHALRKAGDPPFVIAGEGPMRKDLVDLASSLELRQLRFTGHLERSQVSHLIATSAFVVFPSLVEENAPLGALEAMALGRPLIVSDRGGLPELIASGAGVAFPAEDTSELAKKMLDMRSDEPLRKDYGSAARTYWQEELRPETHLSGLTDAFSAAIEEPIRSG